MKEVTKQARNLLSDKVFSVQAAAAEVCPSDSLVL